MGTLIFALMDYQQTIDYLFTRLPLFSRVGAAAYKADLDNTIELCKSFGDPHTKFRSIHVAGTNGKGSVSHMLASILQTAGYKTGLYTSPHLKDFRERIKINGDMIPEDFVISFTEKVKPQIRKLEPSFFEITVAMAFTWFADQQVDIAVIETGLGGRLDSTNIILPELSIITNIGMDHTNLLGDSLEKIAIEKAGIIKKGIPVVIGETASETRVIFENTANQKKAPITFASDKRKALNWYWMKHELVVEVSTGHQTDHRIYQLDLPGIYQIRNLVTVIEACSILNNAGWNISDEIIHRGLKQVKKQTGLHGRWEIIRQAPTVVLDVAHNTDGILQLVQQIEVTDHHELHMVIGFVNDKDIDSILSILPREAKYYFTQANIPRALPYDQLAEKGRSAGLAGTAWPDVNAAFQQALAVASETDLIIICGSVFLVGEIN